MWYKETKANILMNQNEKKKNKCGTEETKGYVLINPKEILRIKSSTKETKPYTNKPKTKY